MIKAKVLILTEGYPSQIFPAHFVFIEEQVKELSKHTEISVICPREIRLPVNNSNKNRRKLNLSLPRKDVRDGVKIYFPRYYCYVPKLNYYFAVFLQICSVLFVILRNRIRFDIVHAHFAYPTGFVGAIISKIFKKPFVLMVHGSDILDNWQNEKFAKKRKFAIRYALTNADKIICASSYMKKQVTDLIGIHKNAIVISYGINLSKFQIQQLAPNNNKEKTILFIGNLIPLKGVDVLINAFEIVKRQIANLKLNIIGEGYLKDELKLSIKQKGLDKEITFLGIIKNKELPKYLNHCNLLCLPSRQEAFGVVLIETMACGKPVVASKIGGIVDIVQSEEAGYLFQPGDVNELAYFLKKALLKKWDQNKIRSFAQKYSREYVASKIIKIYDQLLKNEDSLGD